MLDKLHLITSYNNQPCYDQFKITKSHDYPFHDVIVDDDGTLAYVRLHTGRNRHYQIIIPTHRLWKNNWYQSTNILLNGQIETDCKIKEMDIADDVELSKANQDKLFDPKLIWYRNSREIQALWLYSNRKIDGKRVDAATWNLKTAKRGSAIAKIYNKWVEWKLNNSTNFAKEPTPDTIRIESTVVYKKLYNRCFPNFSMADLCEPDFLTALNFAHLSRITTDLHPNLLEELFFRGVEKIKLTTTKPLDKVIPETKTTKKDQAVNLQVSQAETDEGNSNAGEKHTKTTLGEWMAGVYRNLILGIKAKHPHKVIAKRENLPDGLILGISSDYLR